MFNRYKFIIVIGIVMVFSGTVFASFAQYAKVSACTPGDSFSTCGGACGCGYRHQGSCSGGGVWYADCTLDPACNCTGTMTCYQCSGGACYPYTYTGSSCPTNCDACSGGGGGGSCTATTPSQATLTSPTPGETNVLSPVALRWTDGTSWGVGCPQNNHYQVFLKEVPEGSSCAVAGYSQIANTGALSYTVNVNYNSAYCWFIRKSNGSLFAQTPTRQFVTVKRSVVQNVSIVNAGECFGSNISGRAEEANTSNPIELSIDVSDVRNDFANGINVIDGIYVGVLPVSEQNSSYVANTILEPQLTSRGFFDYTFPEYAGVGFRERSNGTTTSLNDIGTVTHIEQLNNQTWRVYFNIEFKNNYPNGAQNIYVMAVSRTPSGGRVSSAADGASGQNFRYAKSSVVWAVDTVVPGIDISTKGDVEETAFGLSWDVTDSSGINDFQSYCYQGSGTNTLHDLTEGLTIPLGSTPISYPTMGNCGVDETDVGFTRDYTIDAPTTQLYFGGHAIDRACNTNEYTYRLDSPVPWVLTNTGLVSATEGYSQFEIPAVDLSSHPQLGVVGDGSYLGSYSVYSGNNQLLSGRNSENNYFTTNYDDTALVPPSISSVSSWYEQMYEMVSKKQTIVTMSAHNRTLFGNLSTYLTASVNSIKTGYMEGPVTLNSMVCDTKAIVFVQGHLLILPDVVKTAGSSCLFVVSGDVIVDVGMHKGASLASGNPALYDEINAFIITEGTFTDSLDVAGGVGVPDGLLIKGGLIANAVEFNRDLGRDGNAQGPAEAILLDPTVSINLGPLLNINKFSLRSN